MSEQTLGKKWCKHAILFCLCKECNAEPQPPSDAAQTGEEQAINYADSKYNKGGGDWLRVVEAFKVAFHNGAAHARAEAAKEIAELKEKAQFNEVAKITLDLAETQLKAQAEENDATDAAQSAEILRLADLLTAAEARISIAENALEKIKGLVFEDSMHEVEREILKLAYLALNSLRLGQ